MTETKYEYVDILNITEEQLNKKVYLAGRLHDIRKQGSVCFIVLRYQYKTIQCVAFKKNFSNPDSFKDLCSLSPESFIHLSGTISKLPPTIKQIESTYYKHFELKIDSYELISKANILPFNVNDANDAGLSLTHRSDVLINTRLDNRWFDLRIPVNYCIFKIQSGIVQLFRNFLISKNFMEIHTPKIIGTASESGAAVFPIQYFDQKAYLAQSPQLYKQMAINADFHRVFEIGPVFRAEKAFSHRHLCEFVGMDIEMAITPGKNYHEIINLIWELLVYIFEGINKDFKEELQFINEKMPFVPLKYTKDPIIVPFTECVKMLTDAGFKQDHFEDLNTENEKEVGKMIKAKYDTDIFFIDRYPSAVRPFYTMLDPNDKKYSNSYDIIMRCEEICSGAQRIHDHKMLNERIDELGIPKESLSDYIKSFSCGGQKHGGCGFGLERIVMLFLDLKNVRKSSFCPRDPNRLHP
ncbi:MAG: aspartyl-tRNA synthetase [Edafosvirus sp.]|uniref:Aspartyl-tRNA synthetase n=1 Tax=Edafosvirus sp. TaxID=2487765 RepID=A0A3G4ZTI7_9VIRU|nr:MAG: aspartyl-tRNA synthetase [Edafosvirus sp.]